MVKDCYIESEGRVRSRRTRTQPQEILGNALRQDCGPGSGLCIRIGGLGSHMRQNDRYIIINTPDTNKKEIGCNFKNCSRISFCFTQKKPTSKNPSWVGPLYPRAESNRNRQNRNLKFYPLNYGGETECKYINFHEKENLQAKLIFRYCPLHHLSSQPKYSLCQQSAS